MENKAEFHSRLQNKKARKELGIIVISLVCRQVGAIKDQSI